MTRDEFNTLGDYVKGLWPAWTPTNEQRELWYHNLRHVPLDTARTAIASAFAQTRWKEPALVDVLTALHDRRKNQYDANESSISPEHVTQCQREAEEDSATLAHWMPADFERSKVEVITHEPHMKHFVALPAQGRFWTHILVERYAYNRAAIYSSGFITRNGKAIRVPYGTPTQISRDEYWKQEQEVSV